MCVGGGRVTSTWRGQSSALKRRATYGMDTKHPPNAVLGQAPSFVILGNSRGVG